VWSTRPLAPVLNTLTAGQVWGFRLSANPVRSGRAAGAADTKRMGHVTADQQLQWLLDRAPTWGFAIPEGSVEQPQAMLVARGVERFARAGGRPVTLTRCTYEGRLQVEQPARLRAAISAGMGHAKAYGCGLMTLAR
jgi:CRISPR system Cascade subunit CasE